MLAFKFQQNPIFWVLCAILISKILREGLGTVEGAGGDPLLVYPKEFMSKF